MKVFARVPSYVYNRISFCSLQDAGVLRLPRPFLFVTGNLEMDILWQDFEYCSYLFLLVTSATLVVTGALLVVTKKLLELIKT